MEEVDVMTFSPPVRKLQSSQSSPFERQPAERVLRKNSFDDVPVKGMG
jgi:hypothetical protein